MQDQVAEIKSKADIVGVIGEHLELKKAGRNFKAVCPFHTEKTASFIISPELQIYKCFGCGESGDVYEFLQKYDGMDFYEALTFLAKKTGVKLTSRKGKGGGEKQVLYELNAIIAKFYHYVLLNHPAGKPALDYLVKERGIDLATIKKFELGYSPNADFALGAVIKKKKIRMADLQKAGMIYKRGSKVFDRFRGRVIFPLINHRGNVSGFAGRTLPGSSTKLAKYINSPETPVYHKSDLLYGLNIARKYIKAAGYAVLVEGELDMISSWRAGVKNTVAIKGSAVTSSQARLLSRFCDRVVLALDSDAAGGEATIRGMVVCDKFDLEVGVAALGEYKDPDDMARGDPELYKKAILKPTPLWDFVIDSIISKHGLKTGTAKAKVSRELVPVLKSIDDKIVQSHYFRQVARRLGVGMDAVREQVAGSDKRFFEKKEDKLPPNSVSVRDVPTPTRKEMLEKRLLTLAFRHDTKPLVEEGIIDLFATPLYRKIATTFQKYSRKHKEFDATHFSETLPSELTKGFADIFLVDISIGSVQARKELKGVILELKKLYIKSNISRLAKEIRKHEKSGDVRKLKSAEKSFSSLTKELVRLAKS